VLRRTLSERETRKTRLSEDGHWNVFETSGFNNERGYLSNNFFVIVIVPHFLYYTKTSKSSNISVNHSSRTQPYYTWTSIHTHTHTHAYDITWLRFTWKARRTARRGYYRRPVRSFPSVTDNSLLDRPSRPGTLGSCDWTANGVRLLRLVAWPSLPRLTYKHHSPFSIINLVIIIIGKKNSKRTITRVRTLNDHKKQATRIHNSLNIYIHIHIHIYIYI